MNASQVAQALACIKTTAAPVGESGDAQIGSHARPVIGEIGHGLYVAYLVDEGSLLSYVQQQDLQSIQITPEALHRQGLINLSQRANDYLKLRSSSAVHMLLMDGLFEASMILLDNLWDESLADYAPNGAVVAIPARDVLAFCDSKSHQGIAELRRVVAAVFPKADHALSDKLYVRRDGEWQVLA